MEKSKGINNKYTTIDKLSADGEQYYINVRPSQLFLFIPAVHSQKIKGVCVCPRFTK